MLLNAVNHRKQLESNEYTFFLTILGRIPARELFNVKNFVIDREHSAARRLRNGGKAPDPATSNQKLLVGVHQRYQFIKPAFTEFRRFSAEFRNAAVITTHGTNFTHGTNSPLDRSSVEREETIADAQLGISALMKKKKKK